jgi:mono/diheme cytochrome c family protein
LEELKMKSLAVFLGVLVIVFFAGATLGQVEIKKAPLTWHQASITDGGELFSELCAVCHGAGAKGDGPAAVALKNPVPDLTSLAAKNEGKFPREKVEQSIAGKSRVASHGTLEMPIWGQAFEDVRPDIKEFRRSALARQRIYNLTEYLSTIQAE